MTADGRYVQIAAGGDNVWRRFAELIGGDELVQDARYRRSRDRIEKADELEERVGEWVGARTFDEVEGLLVAAWVPVGGIYRAQDIAQDPHYQARSSLIEVEDVEQGPVSMPGIVPKLSGTPGEVAWTGPKLGAHNEEIYRDLLGKSIEEMVAMGESGVI